MRRDDLAVEAAAFLGDGPSLQQAASEARQGLDAVLDWPVRLSSMQSRSGLDADAMLRATELRVDYCGLSDASVGAACVLLRASRALQTVDLGGNQVGDEGAKMLSDALKGNTTLKTLRLHSNAIGASGGTALADLLLANRTLTKLDLRGNHFDSRAEQALRSAGRERVLLHESDERPVPAAMFWSDDELEELQHDDAIELARSMRQRHVDRAGNERVAAADVEPPVAVGHADDGAAPRPRLRDVVAVVDRVEEDAVDRAGGGERADEMVDKVVARAGVMEVPEVTNTATIGRTGRGMALLTVRLGVDIPPVVG